MNNSAAKFRVKLFFLAVLAITIVSGCLFGCAPQISSSSGAKDDGLEATEGVYVSDEQCMSCHGGTYESVADLTADLGDWNPHDSLHGGYLSCNKCHEADREITYNYCSHCHVYEPDPSIQ